MSISTTINRPCAACKHSKRKCSQDCVLAPYFPSTNPLRFFAVHKIFGSNNTKVKLLQLPVDLREDAAECMVTEAYSRIIDPVYGCVGIICQLHQQINETQSEILKTRAQIAEQQQMVNIIDTFSSDQLDAFLFKLKQISETYQRLIEVQYEILKIEAETAELEQDLMFSMEQWLI